LSCRATTGVTPAVATVGRRGCWPNTGRAWANCAVSSRCATGRTGREAVMALVGTTVAALRLTKLLIVTLRLTVVKLVTWATFTCLT
jgi:hypothetical protein